MQIDDPEFNLMRKLMQLKISTVSNADLTIGEFINIANKASVFSNNLGLLVNQPHLDTIIQLLKRNLVLQDCGVTRIILTNVL
jgi:hypothetical protein